MIVAEQKATEKFAAENPKPIASASAGSAGADYSTEPSAGQRQKAMIPSTPSPMRRAVAKAEEAYVGRMRDRLDSSGATSGQPPPSPLSPPVLLLALLLMCSFAPPCPPLLCLVPRVCLGLQGGGGENTRTWAR